MRKRNGWQRLQNWQLKITNLRGRCSATDAAVPFQSGGEQMQSSCESCMYFGYDEEFEEYYCEVNLDEDEMEKFLTDSFQGGCPYYRLEDEYKTVRKQM